MLVKRLIIFAAISVVLLAGIALLPGSDERTTMLMRDKQYTKAFQELTSLYDSGDHRPQILMHLYDLYELYGDEAGMEKMLTQYLHQRPDDLAVNEKLAQFYHLANKHDAYLSQLERLVEISNTRQYADRLLAQLRLSGNIKEETRLLEKLEAKPFFSPAHAQRLAMIHLSGANTKKALQLFRRMDDQSHHESKFWDARLAFFRVLVGAGQTDEAVRRAQNWMASGKNDNRVFIMMTQLEKRGRTDLAVALGQQAVGFDPKITFILVDVLVRHNQFAKAHAYLARWKSANENPTGRDLVRYVKSSIATKNLAAALNAVLKAGLDQAPQQALLAVGEELAFEKQHALLASIRPFINQQTLDHHRVFATKIALLEGRDDLARTHIQNVDPTRLKAHEYGPWLKLYRQLLGAPAAFEQMNALMEAKTLPKPLLRDFAGIAQELGQTTQADQAWAMLGGRFPLNPVQ